MAEFDVNPNLKKYKYSVIMLIFHRNQELVDMAQDCLASVLEFCDRDETEIIVVDNGSTARSTYWEENADTYIRFSKNMGISHGWNAGLKVSKGEYMVIIGDDITARPGWLEAMHEAMQMPDAGMANPHVEHLPVYLGIQENYKWPSGACFMINRNTLNKVGYFAEEDYFPANYEDLDYWFRIYRAGLKLYRNYAVSVLHKEGQTIHSADISSKDSVCRQAFLDKWGVDPTPIFFGDMQMPESFVEK